MQNFTTHAYLIECQTNLHVGSGDNNYGIIEKQVQRDTISTMPIIHASGLKGAFRQYFEEFIKLDNEKIKVLFGSDKNERDKLQQGAIRFFEARLLSIPVRGTGNEVYYRATSCEMVNTFNNTCRDLGLSINLIMPDVINTNANTEFGNFSFFKTITYVGDTVAKIDHSKMNEEVFSHLPVIARNCLENGQSENLWYEEVVPRESRFYFFIAVPNATNGTVNFETDFNNNVHNKIIQIGANATVGYGYCKITKIS